ncbi:MAG: dTMP kinase [Deltaproteobacteria bacterium]|nr:dTMP kinase [Deltaproteobacteria bacterium]
MQGFLSFEGIEGSGKSTQVKLLADHLKSKGYSVLTTEEPGGTGIGHKIRALLLDTKNHMDALTELLLYNASRAQHIREIIYPALTGKKVVITDRFSDSTLAYQGYARGLDSAIIKTLDDIVTPDLKPFLTFLLDLDVEEGLRRNRKVNKEDRFELETVDFHKRVRKGYLHIASEEPNRIKVIPASGSIREIYLQIIDILEKHWP